MKSFRKRFLLIIFAVFSFMLFKGSVYSATESTVIPLEANPYGVVMDSSKGTAYVANEKSDSLSIVDLNTQTVSASIPIGKHPRGVAIDTILNLAIVGNKQEGTVSIIDLNTSTVSYIQVGKEPEGISIDSSTHRAFVANRKDNSVSVIDLVSQTVIQTISVGHEPVDVAIDAGLNIALVVNQHDWNVSIIDLSTLSVIKTIEVGKLPKAIDINPETHLAVIVNEKDNTVSVINLIDWTTSTVLVGKHPVDVAVNGLDNTALVICDEDRSLQIIDLNTKTITKSYALNKQLRGVAVDSYMNVAGISDDKTDSLTLIGLPNPVAVINSISPDTLLRGTKTSKVMLEGKGFIKSSTVSAGDTNLSISFIDNHHIEITIPDSLLEKTGTFQITVTNPAPDGGTSNAVTLSVNNPVPQISALEPMETNAGSPPIKVNIFGTGLFEDTAFSLNDAQRSVEYDSGHKVFLNLTSDDVEFGRFLDMKAFNPTPGGGFSDVVRFTVKNLMPTLVSISPTSIDAGSGSFALTVNGTNFVKTSAVKFNGQSLTTSFISNSVMTAQAPASLANTVGNYPVIVSNPEPGGGESGSISFEVKDQKPVITSVTCYYNDASCSDDTFPAGTVYWFSVYGSKFKSTSKLYVNGSEVPTYYFNTGWVAGYYLFANAGNYNLTIMTNGKTSDAYVVKVSFPKPMIFGVRRAELGSTYFEIYGQNFDNSSVVYLNGNPRYPSISIDRHGSGSIDPNYMFVLLQQGDMSSAGSYELKVTNAYGTSTPYRFDILNPVPYIYYVNNYANIIYSAGSDVSTTIAGAYNSFMPETVFYLSSQGGQNVATLSRGTAYSNGYIDVTIPGSLPVGTYNLWAVNPAPGGGSSDQITVTIAYPTPVISSLSPSTFNLEVGGASTSKTVTINGSNLTNATVFVGDVQIPVITSDFDHVVADVSQSFKQSGQYTIKVATSFGESNTASFTVNITCNLSIVQPYDGSTLSGSKTFVYGYAYTKSLDFGIVINGVVADTHIIQRYPDSSTYWKWVAFVPLTIGSNVINAVMTDGNGASCNRQKTVNVNDIYQPVELRANVTSGIANLTTYFDISTNIPNPVSSYTMNFGDGTLYNGTVFENVSHVYNSPGIYYPVVYIHAGPNNNYYDYIIVNVMSREDMDALLKSKWDGMKAKLISGDVEGALGYFYSGSKDKFRQIFTILGPQLPSLASNMREINMVGVEGIKAEYYIKRHQRGVDISYFIYFIKDENGIWRIYEY